MKPRRPASACTVLLAALALVAALGGCELIQRPTARVTGVSLKDIGLTSATLLFDVEVGNPYAVPLPMVNLDYALSSTGQAFLSGQADAQGAVPASGTRVVPLPVQVNYLQLLNALQQVRPGAVVPYAAELGLSVDPPIGERLRLPVRQEGQLPVPAAPGIEVAEVRWGAIGWEQAGGTVRLRLTNRNSFAAELVKLDYGLSLGGVEVARSSLTRSVSFAADGGTGEVEVPISVSPKSIGLGFFNLITGSGGGYAFSGAVQLGTPFGAMTLPLNQTGQTVFRR